VDGIPRNNVALLFTEELFLAEMPVCMPGLKNTFVDPPTCVINGKTMFDKFRPNIF